KTNNALVTSLFIGDVDTLSTSLLYVARKRNDSGFGPQICCCERTNQSEHRTRCRFDFFKRNSNSEQRVKFPKQRRILRPGEVISLAGFLPNCCSLGFFIRVNSHVNFLCAMQDICDVKTCFWACPLNTPLTVVR
ncbi:hypothetical protein SFRURICE_014374, partial [Spodoptera frugiperda]